jgi:hypothetical protein
MGNEGEHRLPHANSGEAEVASSNQDRQAPKGGTYRRTPGASEYLRDNWGIDRTPTTLDTMRCRGRGPRFFKAGSSVVYLEDDLDAWAQELLGAPVSSTSELHELRQQQAVPEPRPEPRHGLTREPVRA